MSRRPTSARPTLLLDGHSLAYRVYHALPKEMATTKGVVTNAVFGFVSMLLYLVREHRPAGIAVALDRAEPTFRHEIAEEYKASREATPDDLLPQFDMIRQILGSLGIPVLDLAGYEADDILATLATQLRDRGEDVIVVTGDRDCFQLVEDPHVKVLYNRRGVSEYDLLDEAGVAAKTGVPPSKYPLLAALRGDSSDNLSGVPGVGDKTAAKLVATYGDLDTLFARLDELRPRLRADLEDHEQHVRRNATVIRLVRDLAIAVPASDIAMGGWDAETIRHEFERLELRTLWDRLSVLLEGGAFGAGSGDGTAPPATAPPGAAAAGSVGAPSVESVVLVRRPETASDAVAALGDIGARGRRGGIATAARWQGDPGRSPLSGLAVVAAVPGEEGDGGEHPSTHDAVWLASSVLGDAAVTTALGGLIGAGTGAPPLLAHEFKELLRSLLPGGIDCTTLAMDTSVAAYLIDPSSGRYDLAAVASRLGLATEAHYTDGPAQLALDEHGDEAQEVAREAATVERLAPRLRRALQAEGLEHLHDEIECPLVRVLARMEVSGVKVDRGELERISQELSDEATQLQEQVHQLAGHGFNVNSTQQLRTVLYDELELTPQRKTAKGVLSTDAATLERLRGEHPIVPTLLRYREVEKLRSTYGAGLLNEIAADGRIHASFRQTVARTGRLSSERPNLHNIPVRGDLGRQFRRAFVPDDGFVLLVADYDQIELRVLAHLADDPGLREAFSAGADVHRTVAAGVYGVPLDEVTSTQRERAKMVSYGLAYGMEAYGLSQRLGIEVPEAADIIERYFHAFPRVRAYMEETVKEARLHGETRTPLGRKRPLPELHDRNRAIRQAAERQAMNAGIQGLAADIFKTALVRLDRAFEEGGLASRLVLQVHDEVLVEMASRERARVEPLTRAVLTGAAELSVPLEVSMGSGPSWDEAKAG